MKNLKCKFTCKLEIYYFYSDFLKSRGKGQKKWRLAFLSSPAILNGILSLKLQNFAVKSNSENRFTFCQKNSEYAVKK